MQDHKELQGLITESVMAVYAASTDASVYKRLEKYIQDWDEFEFPDKDAAGVKIVDELQSLINHLEKKGLKTQSDSVFRILLHTFPESHFSPVPVQVEAPRFDFGSLKTADLGFDSDEKVADARKAIAAFEKCYRNAVNNLEKLVREVEMKLFREMGTGDAGDLYRSFIEAVDAVAESSVADSPWELMNQLALKVNNNVSAFHQAYVLLHEIRQYKEAQPSESLLQELIKNEVFFLRNYYWKRIDDAAARNDNSSIVYYVDKIMPMVQSAHEKSNLLLLRNNAIKKNDEPIKGCVTFFAVGIAIMFLINFVFSSPGGGGKDREPSRWELFWSSFAPKKESDYAISFAAIPADLKISNRAGLEEVKPSEQKNNRKLSLAELRHVVFQRMRLEYLSQQELTEEETALLQKLWEEYRKRCEFYEYEPEDRERAEIEAQRNMKSILEDAEDIRKKNKPAKKDQAPDDDEETMEEHRLLLSLDNPVHARRIIQRLAELGYYKGNVENSTWDRQARKALIEFKVAKMSLLDDSWNLEAQQALLGK